MCPYQRRQSCVREPELSDQVSVSGALRPKWDIRLFDDQIDDLLGSSLSEAAWHLRAGEGAVAVGAISVLNDDDPAPPPTEMSLTATPPGGHRQDRAGQTGPLEQDDAELYGRATRSTVSDAVSYVLGTTLIVVGGWIIV
jgi:hypothetical protein